MDILRKELEGIYEAQRLESETLAADSIADVRRMAEAVVEVGNGCAVITDAACDHCYIYSGLFGSLMGFAKRERELMETDSSDEDVIYKRIHPEDLVDKRLLEYEFFKRVDPLSGENKRRCQATCRLRMKDRNGIYRYVDNSTQVIHPSPAGKIWLILCRYDLSPEQESLTHGISPHIIYNATGDVESLSFETKRRQLLTDREKEILRLIRDGKPSKQIADILDISIHTVSRHRQNIIAKLSIGNSVEAVTAATAMKLI